jgi:tRNA A-37 threonylcarbamoyl transferase component Bud32
VESTPVALVGRVVGGRYLVEALIADGGLASVYLALDRRLDRRVVMKVMPEQLAADEVFGTRFAREAKAAARLSHPNIVTVLDQGSDGSVHYWTLEHLPGRTLRQVLTERRTMTVRECIAVLDPVLDGLAAAHRIGIVHGDLKPENVFLTDDGRIMVADFGLARAISASSSGSGSRTGSRAYQAPESVGTDVADPLTDVYALGVLLVELLTGQPSVTAIHGPPTDPLAPPTGPTGLPAALQDLVRRATALERERRPVDAAGFQSELRAAVRQVPAQEQDLRVTGPAAARPISDQTEELPAVPAAPATAQWVSSAASAAPAPASGPQPTLVLAVPGRWGLGDAARQSRHHDSHERPGPAGSAGMRRRVPAVAAALVLLLIVTGVWWVVAGPGSSVPTPALTGQQLSDAQQALSERGLTNQVRLVYDAKTKAGLVLSTDPVGGAPAKKNSAVLLTVSKGPETFPVPKVAKMSVTAATAAIREAQLRVGTTTSKYSSEVPTGAVISTSPKAGTELTAGESVDLIISGSGVIRGLNSGRCVDVPSGSRDNGTQTILQDCNNSAGQAWTQTSSGELTIDDGAKCLDVAGASKDDGAIVQIYDCAGVPNQRWKVNPDGTIVGVDSGKCLDATDHRTDNGTPIQMWSCTGGNNQRWSRG